MRVYRETLNVNLPWLLAIHKSLAKKWFVEYSVKDFLANGDIYNNPQNYDEPKWAEQIASYRYILTPQPIEREKCRLGGYCYFQDDPVTGKMRLVHYEPTSKEILEEQGLEPIKRNL